MKVLRLAAALALLAGPAYAQTLPNINLLQEGPTKSDEEKAADAERDAKYKDTLKKIPDAKASNDPWGGMRSDPPKTTAKSSTASTTNSTRPKAAAAAKKTKTGSSAN